MNPHDDCDPEVIRDVFQKSFAALTNFNFYERCATYAPNLRAALKANIHLLPREIALTAVLGKRWMLLERDWPFEAEISSAGDNASLYRVRRPIGAVKRYSIKNGLLHFGKIWLF